MVLDIYVCQSSDDSNAYDYIRTAIYQASSTTDQWNLWVSDEDVPAECGYVAVCTSVFWKAMAEDGMDTAAGLCIRYGMCIRKRRKPDRNRWRSNSSYTNNHTAYADCVDRKGIEENI